LPKIVGAAKCACGYRFHDDDSGRPRLSEETDQPTARRSNGGLAMLFGLAMALGGGYLAHEAYKDRAAGNDMRYLIGGCSGCAGLLCLRRGYDRSTD
jgi:hypothetical protein